MPLTAHAFRAAEGAAPAGSGRGLAALAPGRRRLGPSLSALEKEQQGWDKAQAEKCSGLERRARGGSGITGAQR